MSTNIDLKELERNAYRTNFQDGLWDMFLGLLLFQSVIDLVLYELGWPPALILTTTLIYVVLVLVAFKLVKKSVITPRMGLVNYGAARQAKNKKLMLVLSLSILFGVILFGVAVGGYFTAVNETAANGFPALFVPFGLFLVLAVVIFSVVAYLMDFTRGYLYGWFFGLASPINIFLNESYGITFPLATAVFSTIMFLIGLVLFVRFLQTHPMIDMEV